MTPQYIIEEVQRKANEQNHKVQLYALELFKEEHFKKTHFSGNCYYSDLHRLEHRTKIQIEKMLEIFEYEEMKDFYIRREKIISQIKDIKIDREVERNKFLLNYLTK